MGGGRLWHRARQMGLIRGRCTKGQQGEGHAQHSGYRSGQQSGEAVGRDDQGCPQRPTAAAAAAAARAPAAGATAAAPAAPPPRPRPCRASPAAASA
jgi:hypothetical protein